MLDVSSNDLWPNLDDVDVVRTPTVILKEIAATLGPKTNNLVEAIVTSQQMGGNGVGNTFRQTLVLRAPALGGYTYNLLTIQHDIELWPAKVISPNQSHTSSHGEVRNEEQLRGRLAEVFHHPQTVKVLRSMVAQSKNTQSQVEVPENT